MAKSFVTAFYTLLHQVFSLHNIMHQVFAYSIRSTTMLNKPWQDIHINLCGPFSTGESVLVCEDACTR